MLHGPDCEGFRLLDANYYRGCMLYNKIARRSSHHGHYQDADYMMRMATKWRKNDCEYFCVLLYYEGRWYPAVPLALDYASPSKYCFIMKYLGWTGLTSLCTTDLQNDRFVVYDPVMRDTIERTRRILDEFPDLTLDDGEEEKTLMDFFRRRWFAVYHPWPLCPFKKDGGEFDIRSEKARFIIRMYPEEPDLLRLLCPPPLEGGLDWASIGDEDLHKTCLNVARKQMLEAVQAIDVGPSPIPPSKHGKVLLRAEDLAVFDYRMLDRPEKVIKAIFPCFRKTSVEAVDTDEEEEDSHIPVQQQQLVPPQRMDEEDSEADDDASFQPDEQDDEEEELMMDEDDDEEETTRITKIQEEARLAMKCCRYCWGDGYTEEDMLKLLGIVHTKPSSD